MDVAITFCDETKHQRRENKHDDSFFRGRETPSLARFSQF